MGKSSQRSFYKLGPFRKFIFDINYWRTSVSGVSGLVYQTSPGIWQIDFPNNKISPPTMVALDAVELINSLWAHCPWQNSIANRLSRTQRHNPPSLFEINKRWQLLLFGQSRLPVVGLSMLAVLTWWQKSDVIPQKDSWSTSEPYNKQDWPHWPPYNSSCWIIMSWQFSVMKSLNTSISNYEWFYKKVWPFLFDIILTCPFFVGTVNSPGQVFIGVDFGTSGCRAVGGSQPACWGWGLCPLKNMSCQWKLAIF